MCVLRVVNVCNCLKAHQGKLIHRRLNSLNPGETDAGVRSWVLVATDQLTERCLTCVTRAPFRKANSQSRLILGALFKVGNGLQALLLECFWSCLTDDYCQADRYIGLGRLHKARPRIHPTGPGGGGGWGTWRQIFFVPIYFKILSIQNPLIMM